MQQSGTTAKTFTVWVIESKESPNEALRVALENEVRRQTAEPVLTVRFISETEVTKPLRFALLPDLVILSCEFRPAFDQFIKNAENPSVWVDLVYQNARTLESFRALCQMRGLAGSALDLGPSSLGWALKFLEADRFKHGSLLHCLTGGADGTAPIVHSSRLARNCEVGVRIDHLAKLAGGAPHGWYAAVSGLASLALEFAEEVKGQSAPVLPLYAAELHERSWLVLFQIPVGRKSQGKLPALMARIREDQALRGKLSFNYVTRECGALVVTFSESVIELGIVFNPFDAAPNRMMSPESSFREAILFRKRHYTPAFTPQNCRYAAFPERLRPVEIDPVPEAEAEGGTVTRPATLFEKAADQLGQVHRIGSDESFAAFLKGIDGASGNSDPRYLKLIMAADHSGVENGRELMKDLIKRFFGLVEDTRVRKQRAG